MTVDTNWCTLKISADNMYALMCLHTSDAEEEHCISESVVMDFLKSQNIVYGINQIAICSFLEHVMYEQYVCVAMGSAPTKGQDGYYEFKKNTQDMKKKPLINADGTADYKNSLNLAIINEGELLAVYIPATTGSIGHDVFGKELPSLGNGKEALPLRGRGIRHDDEKINYYAEYSGHIVQDGNQIYIDKLYRVSGDLDIDIGNIHFDGDVEICGDVRSGLEINAGGNIFIHGHVGACILKSGKSITIDKGIQGRDMCEITAKEDIVCKFIERSQLKAGGNIYADSVLNARLVAENQINITSRAGLVLSSEVYGMAGVFVKEAGNDAGMSTLLRAGMPREFYSRAIELQKLIKETESKIDSFNQHLASLDDNSSLNNETGLANIRTQIMRAKIVLDSNKKGYLEELEKLNEKLEHDSENSFISVSGICHNGVRIYIGMYPYFVNESVKEITYTVRAHEVIAQSM